MNAFLKNLLEYIEKRDLGARYYKVVVLSDKDNGGLQQDAIELSHGNAAHDSYSVAKSVTAMAAGILYDRHILSLSDNLGKLLDEFFVEGTDSRWRDITVDQLMRHRTGADGGVDFDLTHALEWEDPEWLHTLFSCPITGTPGKDFVYSDGNFYIMSRIIEKIYGSDLDLLLQRELFSPLSFHQNAWSRDGAGHTLGGTGLYMRTEDMAKLGWLCMNNGLWNGKQIFSHEWADKLHGDQSTGKEDYGYGIPSLSNGGYAACGMYGQGYYFNPATRHVCAWHSYGTDGLAEACKELDV